MNTLTNQSNTMKTLITTCISAVFFTITAHAQFVDMSPVPDSVGFAGLKYSHASFKDTGFGEGPSGASGVYKIYGAFPMKEDWSFYAEIPVIIAKMDGESESGLGNIYLGFQKIINRERTTNLSLGVYLPTIGSERYLKQSIGITADTYGTVQYAEGVTARFTVAHNSINERSALWGIEAGPDIFIGTFEGGGAELMLHYAAKGGYHFGGFAAWAELNGLMAVTGGGNISDRTIHKLVFGGQLMRSKFRPGIFYGLPLNQLQREIVSGILQVKLEFSLGR